MRILLAINALQGHPGKTFMAGRPNPTCVHALWMGDNLLCRDGCSQLWLNGNHEATRGHDVVNYKR